MATQERKSPPARDREARAAAQMPADKLMTEARSKYPKWNQAAYEKLRDGHPSMSKNSKEFAFYLVLKGLRPDPYKKGDCRSFPNFVFIRSANRVASLQRRPS